MWRRCAAAPPGGMRSSHVVAPSSYVRHSRRDPPLDGSLRGFLATPVHHALAPLHRRRRRVAAPWGPPPSPHRPCAQRRRRTEAPLGLHLPPCCICCIGLGLCRLLLSPPFAFLFPCTWLTTIGKKQGRGEKLVCAPEIVPVVLCCCFFFSFSQSKIGFASPSRSSRSSSTLPKDEVVAAPSRLQRRRS